METLKENRLMKKQKRKIFLLIVIIFGIFIFLFLNKKYLNDKFQEELIFFKFFSYNTSSEQPYEFQVSYQSIDFKNINLLDHANQDTLVHKKIAPRNGRRI